MGEAIIVSDRISIYLTVNKETLNDYFNAHDPAPIYKRQLSHMLEEYIMTSVKSHKRYSAIFYKLQCTSEVDKQFAQPLMYAIRRHFELMKMDREREFEKFKKRSWILLGVSVLFAVMCQGFLPLLQLENQVLVGLSNSLDIFSWVLLWRPIDTLLFSWNPHLKDICLLNKLANSEVIIIESDK
jgi:hypothetical protein